MLLPCLLFTVSDVHKTPIKIVTPSWVTSLLSKQILKRKELLLKRSSWVKKGIN